MTSYIIILFIVLVISCIILGCIDWSIENKLGKSCSTCYSFGVIIGWLIALLISIPIINVISKKNQKEPKAIDVYRNKTELKVKYVIENNDTIQSDTTVVFKNI
jgi:uncharacterized membrane protein